MAWPVQTGQRLTTGIVRRFNIGGRADRKPGLSATNKYMQLFQTPALIQGISTLKDKTLKLVVYISRELTGEEKAKLFDLEQKEGWFLFKENAIQPNEVPEETAEAGIERKSPTKRLYDVLYVYWHQNYSGKTKFEDWRRNEMERIIEAYKAKLN